MVGKACQQDSEMAGHIASVLREQSGQEIRSDSPPPHTHTRAPSSDPLSLVRLYLLRISQTLRNSATPWRPNGPTHEPVGGTAQ